MLNKREEVSVAGTWGVEKRKKFGDVDPASKDIYRTISQQTYTHNDFKNTSGKEKNVNKFSKFKTLQLSGSQIIQYNESGLADQDTSPFDSVPADDELRFDHSMRRTSFSNKGEVPDLSRTNSSLLRTRDCAIAVGRSGVRQEKGVSTSGLLGERLMNGPDPKHNSFAQRSWLYNRDVSLDYKVNGVPVAHMPTDVSLALGDNANEKFAGWTYGRKAILTGDILSRSGCNRSGIFQDDFLADNQQDY